MKINYDMVDESLLLYYLSLSEGTELEKWMTGGRTSRMATQFLSMRQGNKDTDELSAKDIPSFTIFSNTGS